MRILGCIVVCFSCLGAVVAQGWTPQVSGTANDLRQVWFTDPLHGWTVGVAGTSLVTANGGVAWSPRVLTAQDLGDVAFLDPATGLIVGDNGLILRSTDGGATWTPVPSPTTNNLAAVAFGGGGLAYAAGRNGTILRSTNRGAGWTLVETGGDRWRDAAAVGTRVWLVGDGGAVRASSDGGLTWAPQSSGTTRDLRGVFFRDPAEGWIAGQNNTLLHTTNGGTTWAPSNTGINVGLDSVFFANATVGWAVGNGGAGFRTIDGGATWIPEVTGTGNELNDVFFTGVCSGWAVGAGGTIVFRSTPDLRVSVTRTDLSWSAVAGALAYDVVRGSVSALRASGGNFALASETCLADNEPGTTVGFTGVPPVGEGWWLLVRPVLAGGPGTYDSCGLAQAAGRDAGIAASGVGCF